MRNGVAHIALLHETKQKPKCRIHDLAISARTCSSLITETLLSLEQAEMLALEDGMVTISPDERFRIAELAIAGGADPEKVARELRWQEFESLANQVLVRDGFTALNHLVFKAEGRRFEIDVVGAREPLILCVDCKHWHHGWAPSKIVAAARNQMLRVVFLSKVFPAHFARLSIGNWSSARLLPVVLTLADVPSRLVDGVPVVPVLRFKSFLSELSPWVETLRFIDVGVSSLSGCSQKT